MTKTKNRLVPKWVKPYLKTKEDKKLYQKYGCLS